jgi:hypothetical protein
MPLRRANDVQARLSILADVRSHRLEADASATEVPTSGAAPASRLEVTPCNQPINAGSVVLSSRNARSAANEMTCIGPASASPVG